MPRSLLAALSLCLAATALGHALAPSALAEETRPWHNFNPAEFSPSSVAEQEMLYAADSLLADKPLPGKTGTLDEQKLELLTRYLKEFPAGKFAPVARDTVISILRKDQRPDELLKIAREMLTPLTSDRLYIAIGFARNHAKITNDPAPALALLEPATKAADPAIAWRADVGVAMVLSTVMRLEDALKKLTERPDAQLSEDAKVERAHASAVMYEQLAAHLKDPAAAKAYEEKMLPALELVMAACEKDPAKNAAYASAFSMAASARVRRVERDAAVAVYEKVLKLFPGTMESAEAESALPQARLLGSPAPQIESTTIDGKPFSLAALKGKIVLVDFWATNCPPCVEEAPNIVKMYADFQKRPFEIVSISLDVAGREKLIDKFLTRTKITWPQLYDGKAFMGKIARAYEVYRMPAIFILDETGKVLRFGIFGDELRKAVDAELTRVEKLAAPK